MSSEHIPTVTITVDEYDKLRDAAKTASVKGFWIKSTGSVISENRYMHNMFVLCTDEEANTLAQTLKDKASIAEGKAYRMEEELRAVNRRIAAFNKMPWHKRLKFKIWEPEK